MNIRGHFSTITHHKMLVMKYCFACGLYKQGLAHDLSKYSPTEFIPGCIYYQGDHSPNEAERQAKGYTAAWLHHKGCNRHHLEYWIDYGGGKVGLVGMKIPLRYICEMVCDRIAASQVYLKDRYTDASAWEYYQRSKDHYLMHPESRAMLEKLLKMVRDKGQDAAFAYMKALLGLHQEYSPRPPPGILTYFFGEKVGKKLFNLYRATASAHVSSCRRFSPVHLSRRLPCGRMPGDVSSHPI